MHMPPGSARQREGYAAEQHALDYLLRRGLVLVARNFRVKLGELDLVMTHGQELVFIEVRRRGSGGFGGAAASVTPLKQMRVRRAAQAFMLARFGQGAWPALRFDVVAIEGEQVNWIAGAF
jgi:putative endonuclease